VVEPLTAIRIAQGRPAQLPEILEVRLADVRPAVAPENPTSDPRPPPYLGSKA
jgi:hypothetical protein